MKPRAQLQPLEFSVRIGALEAGSGTGRRAPVGAFGAVATFEMWEALPTAFISRPQALRLDAAGQM